MTIDIFVRYESLGVGEMVVGVVMLYESQTEGSRLTQQRRFGEAEPG
jgi:hypothetical protein